MNSAEQILNKLDCTHGQHNIFIYGSLDVLREFYAPFCKRALEDNEVAVILSYYEPAKTVYTYLENAGIDVDRYKRTQALFVLDSVHQFFGIGPDFYGFLKILDKGATAHGKNGVCVLANVDAFYLHGSREALIKFETSVTLGEELKNTSMLCMYHAESFTRLSPDDQSLILKQHNKVVR